MSDPFAAALAALYASSMAVAAVYTPAVGAPVSLRVIRSRESVDTIGQFGSGGLVHDREVVHLRIADVPSPAQGDVVTIGSTAYEVIEEPMRDVEGLQWSFGVAPILV